MGNRSHFDPPEWTGRHDLESGKVAQFVSVDPICGTTAAQSHSAATLALVRRRLNGLGFICGLETAHSPSLWGRPPWPQVEIQTFRHRSVAANMICGGGGGRCAAKRGRSCMDSCNATLRSVALMTRTSTHCQGFPTFHPSSTSSPIGDGVERRLRGMLRAVLAGLWESCDRNRCSRVPPGVERFTS
jgi:hypothetical protein